MNRPRFSFARSDGRFFRAQWRSLKGIRNRLGQLKQSWSSDLESLEKEKRVASELFERDHQSQLALQANQAHDQVQAWDTELDKNIANVEREFLKSVTFEKSEVERLKTQFANAKIGLKKDREASIAKLAKTLEDAKLAAVQTRDSIKSKLEGEKRTLGGVIHDAQEWVMLKTGRSFEPFSQTLSADQIEGVRSANDLQKLAKAMEDRKKNIATSIDRMKTQSKVKWLSSVSFHSLGVLAAGIASAICWAVSLPILIVVLVATVGSIALTAILHYATRPMMAKAILKYVPEIVSTERECYELIHQGGRIAEAYAVQEMQRATLVHQQGIEAVEADYHTKRERISLQFEQDCIRVKKDCQQKRYDLIVSRRSNHDEANQRFKPMHENLLASHKAQRKTLAEEKESRLQKLQSEFLGKQERSVLRWRKAGEQTASRMREMNQFLAETQPAWESPHYSQTSWERDTSFTAWRLGSTHPQLPLEQEALALSRELTFPTVEWPVVYDLLSDGALTIYGASDQEPSMDAIVQNVALRAMTCLPAGSLQITIIDPQGLGKKFSWLMTLADVDPHLVGDRVWTQPLHIADKLANTARHVEDVIQQSLRNNFKNLYEYNLQAGPMAIPYRLILWDQFPCGLDDNSWQSLCSIMASGGRCGVGVLLKISDTYVWPSFADPQKLREFGKHIRAKAGNEPLCATLEHPDFSETPIELDTPPSAERTREIMEKQLAAANEIGKMIVPFEQIELPVDEQNAASSADSLSIPIGISSAGRVQSLKLGLGTAQHVLVAGKTGSGKSSLLHTLITSSAMKYSPEALRLVLLDFKKGVEFQVYSEAELPHADIIGIESKREFGVSTLEYLDRVMHARGEAFREWGVQDLPSLSRKHPQVKMPRILIVIDEFQELFVEDDKLSQQASMLMDRIVRQGRSFGMHLVLASQTLGGAYSLPRTTLAQMAVRIALQCDSSDAMLILSEDNTAAERLRHSGQGIYNDAGGRIESNQGFQVAYLSKDEQVKRLNRMPSVPVPHSPTSNALGRRVVFEGHKPAIWDERSIQLAYQSTITDEPGSYSMILGESVSIDPPVIKKITRAAGRNGMIVGADESCAASILAGGIAGFLRAAPSVEAGAVPKPFVHLLDGAKPEDVSIQSLLRTLKSEPRARTISVRELDSFLNGMKDEMNRRLNSPDEVHSSELICVCNIARFRDLRRSEDFSFGDEGNGSKPDAALADLLKDGPAVGLYVWIWGDSAGTMSRWLSRQSLRDIELRILMQMSSTDSNQLIDSNAANRLEKHVVLLQDDLDGKPVKFRPYALDSVPLGQSPSS